MENGQAFMNKLIKEIAQERFTSLFKNFKKEILIMSTKTVFNVIEKTKNVDIEVKKEIICTLVNNLIFKEFVNLQNNIEK